MLKLRVKEHNVTLDTLAAIYNLKRLPTGLSGKNKKIEGEDQMLYRSNLQGLTN